MKIGWTPKSLRSFKRLIRKNPHLIPLLEKTLKQLSENPFHPTLRTHKLKGELEEIWSCSINYQYRILFEFVRNTQEEDAILLLNLGTHDEVY
ncbi:type II toxin-antitoxin system RelE/ParE family toxin [Dactylococcopsis salina]|uniref:Addiction module toxin, RelE/StbE family n=1 Tax=Dactylococcopsis salina (strain PCC 8305) TaxID=13035 RepID=K9YVB9_DACS8|nr:type II toxin-antitoxin system mRNA interferase toxin, RelE/StbE family [Dactylococcopsis salina]AFZ50275.1 addiction module toxin, RelE/StbE family [Dactylococcopsis salina PCC 8305]